MPSVLGQMERWATMGETLAQLLDDDAGYLLVEGLDESLVKEGVDAEKAGEIWPVENCGDMQQHLCRKRSQDGVTSGHDGSE